MNTDTAPIHSCWNEIGVWGARNCSDLEQYVHCRHCPAYMRAAARILDREIPPDYGQGGNDSFVTEETRTAEKVISLIIFRLGDEWLALPTNACAEVAEPGPVHSLPHRSDQTVHGVVNIRGELLVCVNLAQILGIDVPGVGQGPSRFLVYGSGAQRLVFPSTEVHGIYRIPTDEIRSAPATVAKARNSFTRGVLLWTKQSVGVLDGDVLLAAIDRRLS